MTTPLDSSKPADLDLVSTFAGVSRETRTRVNEISALIASLGYSISGRTLEFTGATLLRVGDTPYDVQDIPIEFLFCDLPSSQDLINVLECKDGQVKFFINTTDGNDLTFIHNPIRFVLNGGTNLTLSKYDVIGFINKGGDPVEFVDGIWIELFRTLKI